MSRTLCLYPAEQIYTPDYRSASQEIATRKLALGKSPNGDELADILLDPNYPLVIGVLDGVRTTVENRVEAGLVARHRGPAARAAPGRPSAQVPRHRRG